MAASIDTLNDVADIMVAHIGLDVAIPMVREIVTKTKGNQSYSESMRRLRAILEERKKNYATQDTANSIYEHTKTRR